MGDAWRHMMGNTAVLGSEHFARLLSRGGAPARCEARRQG
jgi:hypothetical protein